VNNFLKELKTESGRYFYRNELAVTDRSGAVCGNLEPISLKEFNETSNQLKLVEWHKASEGSHLLRVPLYDLEITNMLKLTYLSDNPGILFFITTISGQKIGHIGLNRVSANSAELCSLVRGESGGQPRLIEFAERALLKFCFNQMHLRQIYFTILSTNLKAIHLHKRVGFEITAEQALLREELKGHTRHTFVKAEMSNVPYRCLIMSLKSGDFL